MNRGTIQLEQKRGLSSIYPGLALEALQWKIVDGDQGIIRGYLAVFNNVDSYKDRIRAGAFKKTIAEALQRKTTRAKKYLWPLLWMHDPEKPIGGFIDAVEDKHGLLVTAQIDITTNAQGIPNNALATSVYSGFKAGFIDELSIGYKALQKNYDQDGVRDLTEIQLFEGSAVTSMFAANDQALVTDVKAASGGTFPLAPRNTPWSRSKAIKDIEKASGGDWSKASKYFFWSAADPKTEADHKFPFVAEVGGEMKAVPEGIISAAGVIDGAMGGAKGIDDIDGVKAKISAYYKKMGMDTPWSSKDKTGNRHMQFKDFSDRYREEQIKDWMGADFNNLVCALQGAIMDIFAIGDEPQSDALTTVLNGPGGLAEAVQAYVQKGVDLGVSDYLSENNNRSYTSYGYMSRSELLEGKAGRSISKANADQIQGHIDTLSAIANNHVIQHKAITSVVDDLARIIGSIPYVPEGPASVDGPNAGTELDTPNGKTANIGPLNAPNSQPPNGTDDQLDQFTALLLQRLATKAK